DDVDEVAGHREVDLRAADDGDSDADHLAAGVDDRPAGVAGVHAAVDLHPGDDAAVLAQAGDRGGADGDVLAQLGGEGEAEHVDRFGLAQGGGRADVQRRRQVGLVDAEHGQVAGAIDPQDLGGHDPFVQLAAVEGGFYQFGLAAVAVQHADDV